MIFLRVLSLVISSICKYGYDTQLGNFDKKQNKYLETDDTTLHTRERCESLKKIK
ncbi:hypothetical protein BH18THE1_BH18THE1_18350 [soil metagenome]